MRTSDRSFQYDVALSFAGEDRPYVERVALALRASHIAVFYDRFEQTELWGKDLYAHLNEIYTRRARYTVIFASRHFANKLWTNHERKSAQARAFAESQEYLLPVRFDDTEIPGIPPTVGYVDARSTGPTELASRIVEKLAVARGDRAHPVDSRMSPEDRLQILRWRVRRHWKAILGGVLAIVAVSVAWERLTISNRLVPGFGIAFHSGVPDEQDDRINDPPAQPAIEREAGPKAVKRAVLPGPTNLSSPVADRDQPFTPELTHCRDSGEVILNLLPSGIPTGSKLRFDGDARFTDDRASELIRSSPKSYEVDVVGNQIKIVLLAPAAQEFDTLNATLPLMIPGEPKQLVYLRGMHSTEICKNN